MQRLIAVDHLVNLDILRQTSSIKRNRVYSYHKYLDILRRDT